MREELRNEIGHYATDGSSETINVALPITHHYGKEERPIVMVKKKDGSNRVCADKEVEQGHRSRP